MTSDFVMKESNAMINEVVVTGLAGNSLMKDSPTPVSVLTAADIKSVSSTNIIDAIAHQPGISQITTGSGISKPVIRGLGYNRIVTVNDGVRQEGQQWEMNMVLK
ncbi:TonB-dependent receptor plug domain-containing protein [Segatella paludivivens]|uniref:TonB-dependent receptor plug domain-containing protein n=1 Tax=Segatella paludivivens TaxID=185294 RepID=UPI000A572955|nr:TonB-dependent receptor plug domain-containing protein [Segatella paludivivens]